jgi:hypothetical protein
VPRIKDPARSLLAQAADRAALEQLRQPAGSSQSVAPLSIARQAMAVSPWQTAKTLQDDNRGFQSFSQTRPSRRREPAVSRPWTDRSALAHGPTPDSNALGRLGAPAMPQIARSLARTGLRDLPNLGMSYPTKPAAPSSISSRLPAVAVHQVSATMACTCVARRNRHAVLDDPDYGHCTSRALKAVDVTTLRTHRQLCKEARMSSENQHPRKGS